MTKIELMRLIMATFAAGQGSKIVTNKLADKDMKKGRSKANRNPYMGRVLIHAEYSGYAMGTDYALSVANKAQKLGYDVTADDVRKNLKETWHKPCATIEGIEYGKWFVTDIATESKVYLKLQRSEEQNVFYKVEKTYYLDGRKATKEESEDIESWFLSGKGILSSTQREFGLTEENEQHWISPQLDTIEYIQQGERVLRPTELLTEGVREMAMAVATA